MLKVLKYLLQGKKMYLSCVHLRLGIFYNRSCYEMKILKINVYIPTFYICYEVYSLILILNS